MWWKIYPEHTRRQYQITLTLEELDYDSSQKASYISHRDFLAVRLSQYRRYTSNSRHRTLDIGV